MIHARPVAAAVAAVPMLLAGATPATAACPTELLANGNFSHGTRYWSSTANLTLEADSGRLCTAVPGGTSIFYEVTINQLHLPVRAGQRYRFGYTITADPANSYVSKVEIVTAQPPYPNEVAVVENGTSAPERFEHEFTAQNTSDEGAVSFQVGGHPDAWRFCVDDVTLTRR